MNNVFDRFRNQNGSVNILNVMAQFKQVQQDPAQIGKLLYNAGRITSEQYDVIKGMSNPREIGEYLMNHNADFGKMMGHMNR